MIDFFKIIKERMNEDDEESKMFVQIMLSVTEYTNFVEMMRAFKKDKAKDQGMW